MNQTLFNEDFLQLDYLPAENVLIETWYGFVDYARFVTATPIVLQAIQKSGARLLFSDLTKLKLLREDAYSYLIHEKTRQLIKNGVQAYAIAVSPERAASSVIANPIDVQLTLGGNRLELASFRDTRQAGIWLKEKALQPQANM